MSWQAVILCFIMVRSDGNRHEPGFCTGMNALLPLTLSPSQAHTCVSSSCFQASSPISHLMRLLWSMPSVIGLCFCLSFFLTMWTNARATKYIFVLSVVSRRLQEEEQQLRTSSLPAIPNPFPELCSPASSPVLSPGSLPPGEPPTGNYVSPNAHSSCQLLRNSQNNQKALFCF